MLSLFFKRPTLVGLCCGLLLGMPPAIAHESREPMKATPSAAVFGWLEKVTLSPWGVTVKAKLDSGALTSSMHASNVETLTRDGRAWVRFTVDVIDQQSGEKVEKVFEKPLYRKVRVRGAGGAEGRPVVMMHLCIGGQTYEEQFTLNDRSDMLYPVLLGRRTIAHLGLLDVNRKYLQSPHCGADNSAQENTDEDSTDGDSPADDDDEASQRED